MNACVHAFVPHTHARLLIASIQERSENLIMTITIIIQNQTSHMVYKSDGGYINYGMYLILPIIVIVTTNKIK